MIPTDSSVEVLKFLDYGSREALRLVCRAFDRLFIAHFGSSPPIKGKRLRILISECAISCYFVCAKKEKVPDYFTDYEYTDFNYGDAAGDEKAFCFRLESDADFSGVLLDNNIVAENEFLRINRLQEIELSTDHHWHRFNRLVATLPAPPSLIIFPTDVEEPPAIYHETLFENILSYLHLEKKRLAFWRFQLTISVGPSGGEAELGTGIDAFLGRVGEFFLQLTHRVKWDFQLSWRAASKPRLTSQNTIDNATTNQTLAIYRYPSDRHPQRNSILRFFV